MKVNSEALLKFRYKEIASKYEDFFSVLFIF